MVILGNQVRSNPGKCIVRKLDNNGWRTPHRRDTRKWTDDY